MVNKNAIKYAKHSSLQIALNSALEILNYVSFKLFNLNK